MNLFHWFMTYITVIILILAFFKGADDGRD